MALGHDWPWLSLQHMVLPWLVRAMQHLGWAVNLKLLSDCGCVRPRRVTASLSKLLKSWTRFLKGLRYSEPYKSKIQVCAGADLGQDMVNSPPSPAAKHPQSCLHLSSSALLAYPPPPPPLHWGCWGNQGSQSYSCVSSEKAAPWFSFLVRAVFCVFFFNSCNIFLLLIKC